MGLFDWFRGKSAPAAPSKEQISERIVDAKPTAGYKPGTAMRQMFGYGNQLPPLSQFYCDIEIMLMHPRVQIALDYFKSGVASAEFDVTARRPDVKAFIEDQFRRFWQASLSKVQEGYDYGWIGAEIVYRIDDAGLLAFDHIKTFHPRDVRPLMQGYEYCGVRIMNVQGESKPVDLFAPGEKRILGKAFWYAHKSQHGSLHGRSQIIGAWRPYIRLANQDGGEDTVDMACYRFGVRGVVVRYPPGKPNVKPGGGDPRDPTNQQTADFIGENLKAGGNVSLPSDYDEKGNPRWDVQTPEYVLNVDSLVNYNGSLEKQISMGIGVPPELLEASETGSGYSGRQIPLEAFYEGQQNIARDIVRAFREQVVEPLVRWNFGEDEIEFDIEVLPLLQTRAKRNSLPPQQGQEKPANAVTGLPEGVQRSNATPFMMSTLWDAAKHPRGQPENAGEFRPGGGGRSQSKVSAATKIGESAKSSKANKRTQEHQPSAKAARAIASAYRVDATIQRYAEEHNEPKFAKAIGGVSFPDGEPIDIAVAGADGRVAHGIELKTMIDNGNNKITMKRSAMERKAKWEKKNRAVVHTVVLDDSKAFNAKGPGRHDHTKRRMFYRRGYGSFRVGTMYEVKGGIVELKQLLTMAPKKLPQGAA